MKKLQNDELQLIIAIISSKKYCKLICPYPCNGGNNIGGGRDEDNGGDSDGGGHRQQSTKRGSRRDNSCSDGQRWTMKARKIGWWTTVGKG
jgi:hypothetical protein